MKTLDTMQTTYPFNLEQQAIEIGSVCCLIESKSANFIRAICQRYSGFLSKKAPDFVIEVKTLMSTEDGGKQEHLFLGPEAASNRKSVSFFIDMHKNLRAEIDLEEKRACITLYRGDVGADIDAFEAFLALFYSLIMVNQCNGLLLHAAGIARQQKGYAFVGPSGGGKSTVVKLSTDALILGDEAIVVRKVDGCYQVFSTPFNGQFVQTEDIKSKLDAILYLKKDKEVYVKKLKGSEAVSKLLTQGILGGMPFSKEFSDTEITKNTLDICVELVTTIPCYDLHFLDNESFWNIFE